MRYPALALLLPLWLNVVALPVRAHIVDDAFKDVPAEHWAAEAITEMAIKRSLMRAFSDDTFRGEQPLSRSQFAESLSALLDDLEALSRTNWREGTRHDYLLSDVPEAAVNRSLILTLANDYQLWEGVPTINSEHFYPEQTVTRSEVAQVVRNLLLLGESRRAIIPRDPRDPQNPFKDVTPSEWAYHAILADSQRYKVMIGYPDVTFRPEDELTRYQYAAIGSATFGMIRDLVRRTMEERDSLIPARQQDRFSERRPWFFSIAPGGALGESSGALNLGLGSRYVSYPEQFLGLERWFGLAKLHIGFNPGTAATFTVGAFPQGPVFRLASLGELQLQPYVGLRGIFDTASGTSLPSLGLPVLGGLAYWRLDRWGAYVFADSNFFSVGSQVSAVPISELGLGSEYILGPGLSLQGGLGLVTLPSYLQLAPSLGINLAF
ncbi:MAG: S-layer homology domain-containing protein [Cyanobacteria bacterium NC_groundwater_1444_Ag_S-0.65um_54_12]|nr:S-layer homology domain-containing protein [Cyanobacteria bacterium NC_groundwater_1444_Ag_S-0.65um_54_12]